jgi:hypothetical protein
VDESETGSANFCAETGASAPVSALTRKPDRLARVHLRPPSIDKGFQAFLWAAFFFLYLWLGMLAVDVSPATAFIFAAIIGFAIFLFVRIYGEEESSRGRSRARIR